jgi:hypothetical protein
VQVAAVSKLWIEHGHPNPNGDRSCGWMHHFLPFEVCCTHTSFQAMVEI